MLYILDNEAVNFSSKIEKDFPFSFEHGVKIDSTCDCRVFFYDANDHVIILPDNIEIPPMDFASVRCVCDIWCDDDCSATVSIQEKTDGSIRLNANFIVQRPIIGFPVGIRIPRAISLMRREAEIKTPDNHIIRVDKNSTNFKRHDDILCINIPTGINYFIRMRPHLDFVDFPWTNWLSFSATRRRK